MKNKIPRHEEVLLFQVHAIVLHVPDIDSRYAATTK